MKRLILHLIMMMLLLTGCSARAEELENSAVVKALAFDRSEKGYAVSAYIAGAEEGSVISAEAESIAEAFLLLNTRTERRIFLGQLRVIAVSSEIRNMEEMMLYLYSSEDVRSAAKVLIVSGMAKDTLKYKGLYREPSADIEKTMENAEKNANFTTISLYGCVNSMSAEAGCCILPAARLQEENLILEKGTVYRSFRILQTLSAQELAGSAILAEKDSVFLTVEQSSIVLDHIRIGQREDGIVSVRCSYRTAGSPGKDTVGLRSAVEQSVAEALQAVCETAAKVGAVIPGAEDLPENAAFAVSAHPAGNDYPLKGGYSE